MQRRIAAMAAVIVLTTAMQASAGTVSGFEDVGDDHLFAESISWLKTTGITKGCNPPSNTQFCPADRITRGQMATFLARALSLPSPGTADWFSDDDGSPFQDAINQIATAGISKGCNPPSNDNFCPDRSVTRGEMTVFLTRGFGFDEASVADWFSDDDGSPFEDAINQIATAGITNGCNPPSNDNFCPDRSVTRGEMAAFLWRTDRTLPISAPIRIVAAGDIARCELGSDEATGLLLDEMLADTEGVVAALGDTVYNSGTPNEYQDCYEPAWGRHRFRTRPAVGNHEYRTEDAAGYFEYFGEAAGDPDKGWYAYTLGSWQVIVLNSNCSQIGGCNEGSDQEQWLRDELATAAAECTVAYMHHPRFSSGAHGDDDSLTDLWAVLDEYNVEMVLAGHDHNYERFGPMTSDGSLAAADGVQSFVVGTGGTYLRPANTPRPGSETLIDDKHGVLRLDLAHESYEWRFVDTAGITHDRGSRACN